MIHTIVAHGASGWIIWQETSPSRGVREWVCTRDGFVLAAPDSQTKLEPFLAAMLQHSTPLIGAVSLIAELDV